MSNALTNHLLLSSGDRLNVKIRIPFKMRKKPAKSAGQTMAEYNKHYQKNNVSVPETTVKELELLFNDFSFKQTAKYFEPQNSRKNQKAANEYDIDEEDYEWLTAINESRAEKSIPEIEVEKFELAIDRMENCCKFEPQAANSSATTVQYNSGDEAEDVCCVCADGDVSNANQIIYCDMCNIAVHQDCYGVPYIPEGSWLCRKCKLSPSAPVECCLCPYKFGAFKPTSDGRWAHVVCAIWLNEVCFGNAVFLEPIEGCKQSLNDRKSLRCLYCRDKHGACLQCSSRMCFKAFHVTCAQQLGLVMKVETVPNSGSSKDSDDDVEVKRFVYCQKHAAGNNMSEKEIENSIRMARKNLEASGGWRPTITLPFLNRQNVEKIHKETGIEHFEDVVVYWYQKRRVRAGVPLIKRLNVEVVPKERRHHVGSSYGGMGEEDKKTYEWFRIVRNSLETTRLLSETIKKREQHKRSSLLNARKIVQKLIPTPDTVMLETLDRLDEKDHKDVFAKPVKLSGYSTVIKHPMDLSTIRRKLANQKYNNINDLRKDVVLMADNCIKFNHDNDYYLNYGRKFKRTASSIIEDAETRIDQLETFFKNQENAKMQQLCESLFDGLKTQKVEEMEEDVSDGACTSTRKVEDEDEADEKMTNVSMPLLTPTTAVSSRRRVKAGTTPSSEGPPILDAQSPIEQDEQLEENDIPEIQSPASKNSWRSIFTGVPTPTSNKRRNGTAAGTTPKRKKEAPTAGKKQSILPFLSNSSSERLTFQSVAKNGTSLVSSSSNFSPKIGATVSTAGGMFRDCSAVRSPLPAETASSTEESTDEDVIVVQKNRNKRQTQTNLATTPTTPKFDKNTKKKIVRRIRTIGLNESPLERAKNETKSIFAHNAIVNVDGKAAKVIDMHYAHLTSDMSNEQRHQAMTSRPTNGKISSKNGAVSNDELVYVEFFQKLNNAEQYKWVSSERVTLIDLSNTNKSKISGLKAAKEWQQTIMNK